MQKLQATKIASTTITNNTNKPGITITNKSTDKHKHTNITTHTKQALETCRNYKHIPPTLTIQRNKHINTEITRTKQQLQ